MDMRSDKKSEIESNRVRFFIGICNHCAESYEAHTKEDDLIGTEFKCKKLMCQGVVRLKKKGGDESSPDTPPKRYC